MKKFANLLLMILAMLIFAGCAGRRAPVDHDGGHDRGHDRGGRHHPKH